MKKSLIKKNILTWANLTPTRFMLCFRKTIEEENIIESTVSKFISLMEDGLFNGNQQEGMNQARQTRQLSDMATQTDVYEPVRDSPKKLWPTNTRIL